MSGGELRLVGALRPMSQALVDAEVAEGPCILEILLEHVDHAFIRFARVWIGDVAVPQEHWHLVRPRAGSTLTVNVVPAGGDEGGGKNPLRTVLTIAVIAGAFFLGGPLGLALGVPATATIAGTSIALASVVGGALISVAGTLLVNAIAPVQQPDLGRLSGPSGSASEAESPSLFLNGSSNEARPFAPVPMVLGTFRFKPPLAAATFTEVLGDENRLRMLLAIGYGELELADWRIGNTPLDDYDDFRLEVRPGTVSDQPHTIYTNQVFQEEFSIKLTEAIGFVERTSAPDADELSVDLTFPQGLVQFDVETGARISRSVTLQLQWGPVGGPYVPVDPEDATFTFSGVSLAGDELTFTHNRSVTIRHGIRWRTGTRGQYEVRLRRKTADSTCVRVLDEVFWATLRTVTIEDPLAFPKPVATAALDFKATDQINGVLQDLSVQATSKVLDWNGSAWVLRASNNPASLFRHVLQGPGKARPLTDSEIDLPGLQAWHDFCASNGFTYNRVHDFASSVLQVLSDIASAGRASVDIVDGKWAVLIDQPQLIAVTHITPRNSRGFELERGFLDLPDAWRVRFVNEQADYQQEERIVPRTGFTGTPQVFESMEFPGVTDPDQIYKLSRFASAVVENRPERWTVSQDFESLIARRGSRVKVTHDVLIVGLASGRIAGLTVNASNAVTTITTDEELAMEDGRIYGIVVRRSVDGETSVSGRLVTDPGAQTTVTLETPIPAAQAPEVGDLFGFGEFGLETEDALVLSNEPDENLTAKVTLVPYRESVYNVDLEVPPPYVPVISEDLFLPAVSVLEVVTDETVLEQGAGTSALVRAQIRVEPLGRADAHLEVQQAGTGTGEPYYASSVVRQGPDFITLGDVQTGETWDFRVRWNAEGALIPGPWTLAPKTAIIGKSTPPDPLSGLNISSFGGGALLRWDRPEELDVQFGGEVRFRHSPSFSVTSWASSTSIGQAAQARALFAHLPLKPGTYLARVYDELGTPGDVVSVNTKQASVLEFANVTSINEHPTWPGTKTNVVATNGTLKLDGLALIDDQPDWDAIPNFDASGGITAAGTYEFAAGLDLLSVRRVRLTSRVDATSVNEEDNIDSRTELIDSWEDFDGTEQAEADCIVSVRTTDDDPAGSPTWTEWQRLDSMELEFRGAEFKADLTTNSTVYNILVTELGIDVDEVV